jgi:hypothetical protein
LITKHPCTTPVCDSILGCIPEYISCDTPEIEAQKHGCYQVFCNDDESYSSILGCQVQHLKDGCPTLTTAEKVGIGIGALAGIIIGK